MLGICRFFIGLYCQIISHGVHVLPFIYSLISWWIFELFSLSSYYKYSCYKNLYTSFSVGIRFHFSRPVSIGMEFLGHVVILYLQFGKSVKCFTKWYYHFAFSLAVYKRSDFSTFSQALCFFWLLLFFIVTILMCKMLLNSDI